MNLPASHEDEPKPRLIEHGQDYSIYINLFSPLKNSSVEEKNEGKIKEKYFEYLMCCSVNPTCHDF